ncbi:MAG: hypothetical protein WCP46_08415 [Alphaproteobacteria bacterium]|jgi:hypothetical protein
MLLTSVILYIMTTNQSLSFGQLTYILSKSKDHLILERFKPVEAYNNYWKNKLLILQKQSNLFVICATKKQL